MGVGRHGATGAGLVLIPSTDIMELRQLFHGSGKTRMRAPTATVAACVNRAMVMVGEGAAQPRLSPRSASSSRYLAQSWS
jgi:hypothetical protein